MASSTPTQTIILASGSPRRRQLLGALGLPFEIVTSGVSENIPPDLTPEQAMQMLAERKASAVAANIPAGLVIGSDTEVVLGSQILGKPQDTDDAARILRALRGRPHKVITGLAVIDASTSAVETGIVSTLVHMADYTDEQIAAYVASGEPMDKAGAYAIQGLGGALVACIEGCYNNVVGFPLCEVAAVLARFGVSVNITAGPVCALPDGSPCPQLTK